MKEVDGVADFVVAIGKAFEFALGIGLGAESDVVNTAAAAAEAVDKDEVAFVGVHGTKAVAELGFDVLGSEISRIL